MKPSRSTHRIPRGLPVAVPEVSSSWGPWQQRGLYLSLRPGKVDGYDIALNRITSSDEAQSWLDHLRSKRWAGSDVAWGYQQAVADLFGWAVTV